ncbi:MAG TPA: phosphatidate cytidylyltransferase [Planctomycetota bacterium]|nr:phosphatidate cytidylyltransferase [Planctomycetota bacterium]
MLGARVFAAFCMIAVLSAALWVDLAIFKDSILLHAVFLIGVIFGSLEFWHLCRMTGHQTFSWWGTCSACGLVGIHYYSMQLMTEGSIEAAQTAANLTMGALAVALLGTFFLSYKRHHLEASLGGVAVTCLGLLYIFFLPSFFVKLRHINPHTGMLGGSPEQWNLFGHKMVVATLVLAKGCDVWAYLVGRMLGKHKAFPLLSPGKTIEGVAAGLVGSVLSALFLRWEPIGVLSHFSVLSTCILGLAIGLAGIAGDLAESLLKRSAGAKDAGHVVPGYGGTLDVVDSLMVAGPVAYFLIPAIM